MEVKPVTPPPQPKNKPHFQALTAVCNGGHIYELWDPNIREEHIVAAMGYETKAIMIVDSSSSQKHIRDILDGVGGPLKQLIAIKVGKWSGSSYLYFIKRL